jgi:hypothetical protein
MEINGLLAQNRAPPEAIDNKLQGLTNLVASGHIQLLSHLSRITKMTQLRTQLLACLEPGGRTRTN